jgi:hypothetical protein
LHDHLSASELPFLTVHPDCFQEEHYLLNLFYYVQLSKGRQRIQVAFARFKGKGGGEHKDQAQRQDGIPVKQNPRLALWGFYLVGIIRKYFKNS